MEIDSSSRQPDRNKEPDIMDTTINADSTKTTHHAENEQPQQATGPSMSTASGAKTVVEGTDKAGVLSVTMPEQTAPTPPKPRLTEDILSLYGLQPLVATVARTDPVTGEKINKLRSSYQNHLKTYCLAGRNKAAKTDPKNQLITLAGWPEEEFHNQRVVGKDLMQGFPAATLAKLEKAMDMRPGMVRENDKWEDILGHGKAKPAVATSDKKGKGINIAAQPNGQVNGNRTNAAKRVNSEEARLLRAGKKRSYNDNSFEGYAEGFEDDEADDFGGDGYSSEEHSRKGGAPKKRKKSSRDFGATSPATSDRGMLGSSSYTR